MKRMRFAISMIQIVTTFDILQDISQTLPKSGKISIFISFNHSLAVLAVLIGALFSTKTIFSPTSEGGRYGEISFRRLEVASQDRGVIQQADDRKQVKRGPWSFNQRAIRVERGTMRLGSGCLTVHCSVKKTKLGRGSLCLLTIDQSIRAGKESLLASR